MTSRRLTFVTVTRRTLVMVRSAEDAGVPNAVRLDPLNTGDTHVIEFTLVKDGVPWDLSGPGASVAVRAMKPDAGTVVDWVMAAEDAENGVFRYAVLTTDLDQAGNWSLAVVADDGAGVVKTFAGDVSLEVSGRPWYG